jgi:hypothetical protein
VRPPLDRLNLPSSAREDINRELRKVAGADLTHLSQIPPREQRAARAIIDEGFVFSFRWVICAAAGLALAAAGFGNAIRRE